MKEKALGITAILFVWALDLSATPFVSNRCSPKKARIKHPELGQGVMFDENCQTAYVLPPETGQIRVKAVAPTANVNFCPSVNKLPRLAEDMVTALEIVSKKILGMLGEFSREQNNLKKLQGQIEDLKVQQSKLSQRLSDVTETKDELAEAYSIARDELRDCLVVHDESECQYQRSQQKLAEARWHNLRQGEWRRLQTKERVSQARLTRKEGEYARKTSELAASLNPLYELQDRVLGLKSQIAGLYKEYAPLRAVTAQMLYRVQWSELLNAYQQSNPDLNFVKMPILQARIHATAFVDGQRGDVGIPVLLSGEVAGLEPFGVSEIGSRDKKVEPDYATPSRVASLALGIGDVAVSGQVSLSAVGACPFYPEGLSGARTSISELAALLTVNASYDFPVKARRKYTAQYRLSQLMQRIERRTKRGGFLSPRAVNEVLESKRSSEWFKIQFDSDDPDFSYSAAEQDAITRQVKQGLIERSLAQVAAVTFTADRPKLPELVPTGASLLAKGLKQNCGVWLFCRIGGFVLKSYDGLFGRSEAVARFKRENDVWLTEQVDQVAVMRRKTSLTFTAK